MTIILVPAYGRDYKTAAEAKAEWFAGKDFLMAPQGCYCSCRDFGKDQEVCIRYRSLRLVVIFRNDAEK